MKKLIISLFLGLFMVSITVWAASGDICGSIYATDIVCYINSVEVPSYNIGGNTVVVVEDITNQYRYYDALRTLIIDDFAPERLVGGSNQNSQKPGKIVGNIYETDIKTYYRGKELNTFSLNGKMAVIIEELGMDNAFSETGGRYFWNENLRTITLETLYRYPYSMRNMLEDMGYNMILTEVDNGSKLEAKPVEAPLVGGYILCEKEIPDNTIVPVTYDGETIGYRCKFPDLYVETDENGAYQTREIYPLVEFFYVEKVEELIFKEGKITPTAEHWLNYFKNHTISTIKEQFETDEYLFLYMFSSYVMNGSDRLIKINKADGTKFEYQHSLGSESYKRFDNVVIDEENQKVYFSYDIDYVINLKTDEIRAYQKLETDIGIGSPEGQPSEYDEHGARNAQYEYKLISGEEEKIVNGFSTPEFYYADMLPLKETFEFLNIKFSFENDVLIIDSTEAKPFVYEVLNHNIDVLGDKPMSYLYVDKVLLNGEETEVTYQYISGHFQNTHTGRAKAMPYVCNGKVYINSSFIRLLCEKMIEK